MTGVAALHGTARINTITDHAPLTSIHPTNTAPPPLPPQPPTNGTRPSRQRTPECLGRPRGAARPGGPLLSPLPRDDPNNTKPPPAPITVESRHRKPAGGDRRGSGASGPSEGNRRKPQADEVDDAVSAAQGGRPAT